jgi:hypothetical protein
MAIGGYFKLNYHRLLMAIDKKNSNVYWWLLIVINGYYISDYC